MFAHHCSSCETTYLIFDSQITGLTNTETGIELRFTCWCGVEQSELTGRRAPVAVAA